MPFKNSQKANIIRIIAAIKTERQSGPITNLESFGFNSIIDDLYPSAEIRLRLISAILGGLGGDYWTAANVDNHKKLEKIYEEANYKDYIDVLEKEGFTITLQDIQSAAAKTNNIDFAVLASACSSLRWLRFNTLETISFLLKANATRLAALYQEASEMYDCFASTAIYYNINVNSHYEPLEETLELIMANKPVDSSSPLQKWWKSDDLLSEGFKDHLRGYARFSRLNAIHGGVTSYPGILSYVKLKYELMLAGVVDSEDSTFDTRYQNMVLQNFKTNTVLISVAFDQIKNRKPITDFVLPEPHREIIPLTTDVHSLERVIETLKRRYIIQEDSAEVELKLAALKEQWPTIAKQRVLNHTFDGSDYPKLIEDSQSLYVRFQMNADIGFQRLMNENSNLIATGVVYGSLLLALVTACYFKDRIGGMVMFGTRGVGNLLSTVGLLKPKRTHIRLENVSKVDEIRMLIKRQ